MNQQIVISGIGGQGVLFLTRIIAEAAMEKGLPVLTSETHGMAMRGGTVISHVKTGPFHSPLIRTAQADIGFFLNAANLDVHRGFLKPGGLLFINTPKPGDYLHVDATRIAKANGFLVITNLVLLGFAISKGDLFCDAALVENVIRRLSSDKQVESNLQGFSLGVAAGTTN
jgi:indolepyruvate ferredoxin oxidoreductase, beta subunit